MILLTSSVNVGHSPNSINVNQLDGIAYVANLESDTASAIDGETLKVSSVNVSNTPTYVFVNDKAYNFLEDIAYGNLDTNTVSVIDGTSGEIIENVTVGDSPMDVAVHIDGAAYVANSESDTVSVIEEMDGNSVI